MATVDEIKIIVSAEVDNAMAKLRQLEQTAQTNRSSFDKLKSTFGTMRDVMQGPIAGFNLAMSGLQKIKAVTDQMEGAWKVQERAVSNLNAVLRATGGSAGLSSEHIQNMASSLQQVTVYGDEAIISMNAILLGFRSITGDTFDRTTKAILDMSTIMGTDLPSAANMLGKALDSPKQGMAALSRVGFVWTQEQRDMIEAMEESGDLMGAQNVILQEVEKAFGGAAEAAGQTGSAIKDKLNNAIGDLNEQMGRAVTNSLKPYREQWLGMAQAIGASLKAQNDFREAIERSNKGTATNSDNLIIAQNALSKMREEQEKMSKGRASRDEGLFGNSDQIEKDIQLQLEIIKGLEANRKYTEAANAAAAAGNKLAEEAAKLAAEKEARNVKALQLGQAAYQAVIDMEASEQRRFEVMGDLVDYQSLSNAAWAEAEGLLANSNGLISEANPLYQRLVELSKAWAVSARDVNYELSQVSSVAILDYTQQVGLLTEEEAAYLDQVKATNDAIQAKIDLQTQLRDVAIDGSMQMAEAFGAALVLGEEGWKAFGKAGLNAVAAVIEALAQAEIAKAIAAIASVVGAPLAPGHFAAAAGLYAASGLVKAIPMAEGGEGIVTKPTLFLAGEAGPEPFAFGGANNKRGMGGTVVNNTVNQYIAGSVIAEREVKQLAMAGMAQASRGY